MFVRCIALVHWQGLDDVTKMELAAVLTPVVVLPSHELCKVGDRADCLWLLQDGSAQSFLLSSFFTYIRTVQTTHSCMHARRWQARTPSLSSGDYDGVWWHAGTLEMISKHFQQRKLLAAPAVIGESAILTHSMPELQRRSASFRALGKACTAWRLGMDDLQVRPSVKTPPTSHSYNSCDVGSTYAGACLLSIHGCLLSGEFFSRK